MRLQLSTYIDNHQRPTLGVTFLLHNTAEFMSPTALANAKAHQLSELYAFARGYLNPNIWSIVLDVGCGCLYLLPESKTAQVDEGLKVLKQVAHDWSERNKELN